jgi:ABC-type sugar transport system ATPase subunit
MNSLHPSSSADQPFGLEEGGNPPLLQVRGINKAFAGVPALIDVDLEFHAGRVHALLGQNGAGKSTLISIISGVLQPDSGTMAIDGQAVEFASPAEALAGGVVAVYQELSLLPDMTVAENLYLGIEPRRAGLLDRSAMVSGARELLDRLGASGIDANAQVGDLTLAAQQLVEVAKALTRQARILILDEPSAVLGDDELELLYALIERLTQSGIGVVYITHRLDEVIRIADEATVMRDGRVALRLTRDELSHDRMIEAMVGHKVRRDAPPKWSAIGHGEAASRWNGLVVTDLVVSDSDPRGLSFTLEPGTILGIAGLTGSGRSRLLRALAGIDPPASGSVTWEGEAVRMRTPRAAIASGVVLVPEDRKRQGLIIGQSVEFNIALSALKRIGRGGWISGSSLSSLATLMVTRLRVKTAGIRQQVQFLSGGNQQKVVLARCLSTNPRLLLLDEPFRGVDVGAKAEIADLIGDIASKGTSVIVVSSEIEDVLALTDRVFVMRDGRIATELVGPEATEEKILHASAVHSS